MDEVIFPKPWMTSIQASSLETVSYVMDRRDVLIILLKDGLLLCEKLLNVRLSLRQISNKVGNITAFMLIGSVNALFFIPDFILKCI